MRLKAIVAGVGMTRFMKYPDKGLKQLGSEAAQAAVADAGLELADLEAAYVGNCAAGLVTGQESIRGQVILSTIGVGKIPIINVENACASGSTALLQACAMVSSGLYDTVLALGVEKLYPYDIWAPIATHKEAVPYTQAVDWISQGLKPLGEDYVKALRQGCLQDRWVDVYPNQGKRQGAFSAGSRGTMPFIMMSYGDSLQAMSTLAHELGHSLHSYFAWQTQPMVYSDYSLFVAEVASNFNQAMVRHYLMANNPDLEFQIAVIEEAMSNFFRYFFIMPTLARFELEMHQRVERGEAPNADDMTALMAGLLAEGYGDELAYNHDQSGITWAQFGHMYANFYVFQYATGISAAHALAGPIAAGDAEAAERYRQFLKAGSSLDPIDALKLAGVDMATPVAVEKTFAVLSDYVDRLEQLVDARSS